MSLTTNEIKIPLSKTKIFFSLIGAVLFVILGYYLLTFFPDHQSKYNRNYVMVLGIICMVFFGVIALYAMRKLFDTKPGLVINIQGIYDHSSYMSVGQIEWRDISEVRVIKEKAYKFLHLILNNPEVYVGRAKNGMVGKMLEMNQNRYGTPIVLSSLSLKCSFSDMEKWIREGWERSKMEK